jgi:TP901 family phage tail tape measure protein
MVKVASLRLGIDPTAAEAGAKRFNVAAKKVQRNAVSAAGGLNKMVGALAAFAGVIGTVKTIANFELRMAALGKVTKATEEQLAALTARARELGASTQFKAEEAAEGLLALGRAGFTVEQSLAAIADTLDLATAAELELGEASGFVANSIKQFSLSAGEANRVASTFVQTANSANTDVRQLAEAMGYAGTVAGTLGLSVETTAALIGALGNSGIQGSMAGTNLRGVLLGLTEDTDKTAAALGQLNLTFADVDIANNDALDVFDKLGAAMEGLKNPLDAAGISAQLFGNRNAAAAISMARQSKEVRRLKEESEALDDAHAQVARTLEQQLIGRFKALGSATQDVMLSVGEEGLTGALHGLVETAIDVVQIIGGVEDSIKDANAMALALLATLAAMTATRVIAGIRALGVALIGVGAGFTGVMSAATPLLTIIGLVGLSMWQASKRAQAYRESVADLEGAMKTYRDIERHTLLGTGEGPGLDAEIARLEAALQAANEGVNDIRIFNEAGIDTSSLELKPTKTDPQRRTTSGRTFSTEFWKDGPKEPPTEIADQEALIMLLEEELETRKKLLAKSQEATLERNGLFQAEKEAAERHLAENDALSKALELERDRAQLQSARQSMEDRAQGYKLLAENVYLTAEAFDELTRKQSIETEAHRARANIDNMIADARDADDQERLEMLYKEQDALDDVTQELLRQNEALDDLQSKRALVLEFQSSFVDMFSDFITGSQSAGDAFEDFAKRMLAAMTEMILKKALMDAFFNSGDSPAATPGDSGASTGLVLNSKPTARGAYFNGAGQRFASGGIVGSPTNFLYAGGMGLMGEAGPEAIMPIGRDSRGALGVKVADGGSSRQSVTVNMTVNATDADSFRRSKGQIISDLTRATSRMNRNTT